MTRNSLINRIGGWAEKFGNFTWLVVQKDNFANFGWGCPRELRFSPGIAKFKGLGGWAEKFGIFTWLVTQKDNFANFG